MECVKPYLIASPSSNVNLCDEMLVTVSFELNGKTQFLVSFLNFF